MQSNISNNKSFFTKKNILFLLIFFSLTIIILFLTFWFILKINGRSLGESFNIGVNSLNGGSFIIAILACIVVNRIIGAYSISLRLKQSNIKTKKSEYLAHMMIVSFIGLISPLPLITSSYVIYGLKSVGVKLSDATAYTFFANFISALAAFCITLPAGIGVLINSTTIGNYSDGWSGGIFSVGSLTYILTFGGMGIYVMALILQFSLGNSKRVHYGLSRTGNRIKQFLHLEHHTKEQTKETYIVNAQMKSLFLSYFKNHKLLLTLFLIGLANEVLSYSTNLCGMAYANIAFNLNIDYGRMFNIVNISFTANTMIPLPGGNGSFQMIMKTLMATIGNIPDDGTQTKMDFISNGLAINTLFAYAVGSLGIIGLARLFIIEGKKRRRKLNKQ